MIKNTINNIGFSLINKTTGDTITTGTPTISLIKDSGTLVAATNAAVYVSNNIWKLQVTDSESDCDHLLVGIELTDAIQLTLNFYPKTLPPTAEQISGQMSANIESDDNGWDTALYNFVTNYMLPNGVAAETKQDTIIASIVQPVRQIIRTSDDTNPIFFEWENNSTTFTVGNQKVYIDGGTVQTIAGAISFAYTTPLGKHIYKIAHNAADRPVGKGVAAYWINQNSIEVPIALSVIPSEEDIAIETDARLLDAGDATDLIASMVSRIGNTNVDQTTLVAAFRLALVNNPVPAASIVDKTGISSFDPTTDTVARVTLVDTTTTNTDLSVVADAVTGATLRGELGLSSANLDAQLNKINELIRGSIIQIERYTDDTKTIYFSVSTTAINPAIHVSINGASFVPVAGTITPSTVYDDIEGETFFELAYNSADRPPSEGFALYRITSEGVTSYLNLLVLNRIDADAIRDAIGITEPDLDDQLNEIQVSVNTVNNKLNSQTYNPFI